MKIAGIALLELLGIVAIAAMVLMDMMTTRRSVASTRSVSQCAWSPSGKYETECRHILEQLFAKPFAKVRPAFLRNPKTGRNLEIDIFNAELALAVEYDGIFHAQFEPRFHRHLADFQYQQEKDRLKDHLCAANNVVLIRIPHTVPFQRLKQHIVQELQLHPQLASQMHAQ
jgi:hypothetical protein